MSRSAGPIGGYEPISLAEWCNAGPEGTSAGLPGPPLVGFQTIRGIPFEIGDPARPERSSFIVLREGEPSVTVPIGRTARTVIVAHRQLEKVTGRVPGAGSPVARYVFTLESGRRIALDMRERFEINTVAPEGWFVDGTLCAAGDVGAERFDRLRGEWAYSAGRLVEVLSGIPRAYYLWTWSNPEPDVPIRSVELAALGGRTLVAALTIGTVEEHPFRSSSAHTVRIDLAEAVPTDPAAGPTLDVDRGLASYPYPLPGQPLESSLADPLIGWGEPVDDQADRLYAQVAATPSATLSIALGDQDLGAVNWSDVRRKGGAQADGVRAQVVEEGRNWVHVRVLDADTGKPTPCRVHFRSPDGVPYQPHGHHDHLLSDLPTWGIDIGGDVRLGRITYAYIDGTCQGWLPRGDVVVDVAKGFEYEPLREVVRVEPGQRDLTLRIRRWSSMAKDGWYSGDTHVHFLSAQGALTEQQGEDLHVVNLLQSQWGRWFTNVEEFTGRSLESADGAYVTWVGQENRQPVLGHVGLLGLRTPVLPLCSDGPPEAEPGASIETTLSHWADEAHSQGATVVAAHIPRPNGELPALVATGRADALEMIVQLEDPHAEYYRYLNCGYRMPLVAGTDKMSADVPVGLYRTYAKLDDEFGFDAWRRALHSGRTFVSSGPIIELEVEGAGIGDTVELSGAGMVGVRARARSIFPIHTLQIVKNGEVIATKQADAPEGSRELDLFDNVKIESHSWIAARCGGPHYLDSPRHRDAWQRGIFAHTSPVYVACGGEWWMFDAAVAAYMQTLLEGSLAHIRERTADDDPLLITHHHGERDHRAFLERPLLEGLAAIRGRSAHPSDLRAGHS